MTKPKRTYELKYRKRARSLRRKSPARSISPKKSIKVPVSPAKSRLVKWVSGHTAEVLGTTAVATTGLLGREVMDSINKYIKKRPPMFIVLTNMCDGFLLVNTFERKVDCYDNYIIDTDPRGHQQLTRPSEAKTKQKDPYTKFRNVTLQQPIVANLIIPEDGNNRAKYFIYSAKDKLDAFTNVDRFIAALKAYDVFLTINP